VVAQPLIPVGDHRPTPVPATTPNNVHRVDGEGVRGTHHRADVRIIPEVLDGHV